MSGYLYEIRIHEKQQENKTTYSITFHGEKKLLEKMTQLAIKDSAFLAYKDASKWKKKLFKQPYIFSIQDVPTRDATYPFWNLAKVLQGNEVIQLSDPYRSIHTAKALQEELMSFAAKTASRQGNLFK